MELTAQPVEHEDVARCIDIRIECLGSLVVGKLPPFLGYREQQEASIHNDIDHNPHVQNWKVLDVKSGEIIAYAKWVMHEPGRPDTKKAQKPKGTVLKKEDEHWRLRQAAYDYFQSRYRQLADVPHIRKSGFWIASATSQPNA